MVAWMDLARRKSTKAPQIFPIGYIQYRVDSSRRHQLQWLRRPRSPVLKSDETCHSSRMCREHEGSRPIHQSSCDSCVATRARDEDRKVFDVNHLCLENPRTLFRRAIPTCDLKSHRNPTYSRKHDPHRAPLERPRARPDARHDQTLTQRHADANRLTEALIALQNSPPPSTEAPTHPPFFTRLPCTHLALTVAQTTVSGSTGGCKRARAEAEAARRWLTGRLPHSQCPFTELHSPSILHASRYPDGISSNRSSILPYEIVRTFGVLSLARMCGSSLRRAKHLGAHLAALSQIRSRRFDLADSISPRTASG
jgi:hypothetical protein